MIYLLLQEETVEGEFTGRMLPYLSCCYPSYSVAPHIPDVFMLTGYDLVVVRERETYHNIGEGPCTGWENGPCADGPLPQVTPWPTVL